MPGFRSLRTGLVLAGVLLLPPALNAQGAAARTRAQVQASFDAHKGDFDYLLGDWRFEGVSKQYGTFQGYWSAVRLAGDGQILDEYRVVGDSGQTYSLSSTLRSYDALRDRWELVSVGNPNGLRDVGTGQRVGNEVHIEQSFGVGGPHPSLWRIRYRDIGPDHFSWGADCSGDGGKTWTPDCQHLEARRIGPPRSVAPLTPPKQAGLGAR
jgi:hypothetical protein